MDKNVKNTQAIKSNPSRDELVIFGKRLVDEIRKTICKKMKI